MRIGGIFKANSLIGSYLVGDPFFLSHFDSPLPVAVLLRTASSSPGVESALSHALAAYPTLKIQTCAQFEQSQRQQVNKLLGLICTVLCYWPASPSSASSTPSSSRCSNVRTRSGCCVPWGWSESR